LGDLPYGHTIVHTAREETAMHAVVFEVDMKPDWEGDRDRELEQLTTMVKSIPGFVRGSWATDGPRGISYIVFDSAEVAKGVAANASLPPSASATLRAVNVYEIAREA
jgi:hypothetical protein